MCGLAGMFDTAGRRPIDEGVLRRMTDALFHRGPDGSGFYLQPGVGLGHRRLSIIDIEGGAQPMTDPETGVTVAYNGEIYNFPDLMDQLAAKGYRFQSRCDTEVILHGWREWGPGCVDRFDGMFAFALWDPRQETLLLARDRFGKKPLYYAALADGLLLFGSELKALMHHPGLPRNIDAQAVEDYFTLQYIPEPKSIYKAVRKLPAAHSLIWKRGGAARTGPYWDLALDGGSDPGAPAGVVERLGTATKARLIADVPLGAFLSGGVDSGAVISCMAGAMSEPVKTFTIGYENVPEDESALAQQVATRYGTDHTLRRLDPDDFDLVDRLAEIYDEPYGDSSAMPTFRVAELARQKVTVALSGDGGDEIFAGYDRYRGFMRLHAIRRRLPAGLRKPLFGALAALYPKGDRAPRWMRGKTSFQQLAMDDLDAHFAAVSAQSGRPLRQLMSRDFTAALGGYRAIEALRPHWEKARGADMLTRLQYTDLKTWLPADILTKVDRASMANSLEVRCPLLDHRLAEWGVNLPRTSKLDGGMGKAILKRAMEPFLPHELLYKPKQGFAPPINRWIREGARDYVRERLTSGRLLESGYVDPDAVVRMLDLHQSGRRHYGRVLWLLLMFQGFLDHDASYGKSP